ncbi:hypothetical protein LWI29_025283 [Acer saccharum]|uniref:NB-ARC domain-containing protein n=1 Tax=Acer saccharum TaxID=4024 RepID=A0AA39T2U6_ACESA|nr:hypothetical protein LWI29_025283 [Acer saccharum]
MEFLGSLVEIGKMIWTPITKWFGYSNNIDENVQSLKRKIDDLSNQEDDINAELMNAELRLGKRWKKKVDVWLKEIPTAPMGRGITVERNMGMIWESLMDDEVQKIGVFGMGGVGKTTIIHHINNQLMGMTGKFDNAIWVMFSKAFSVVRLQNEIAASVNLDLSDYKDETRRASKLYAMLTQMKRYVLILDDLWEAFPLEKVGLPEPTRMNGYEGLITERIGEQAATDKGHTILNKLENTCLLEGTAGK